LQAHQNEKIYKKSFQMIEAYFNSEEDDNSLMPQIDASQQHFEFNVPTQLNQQEPNSGSVNQGQLTSEPNNSNNNNNTLPGGSGANFNF
jgi:hypothetical protein